MATLPSTPFTLKGGCFCTAIRYTVSIPALTERPIIPLAPVDVPIGPQNETTSRLPEISLDHCNSCRRVAGSVIQLWLILPQSWVQFHLLPKSNQTPFLKNHSEEEEETKRIEPQTIDVISGASEIVENTFVTKFSSSKGVNRTFCGRCGTHISFQYEDSGKSEMVTQAEKDGRTWEPHMDLTVGSLDSEFVEMDGFRPRSAGYMEDGIKWVKRWLKEGEESLLK